MWSPAIRPDEGFNLGPEQWRTAAAIAGTWHGKTMDLYRPAKSSGPMGAPRAILGFETEKTSAENFLARADPSLEDVGNKG